MLEGFLSKPSWIVRTTYNYIPPLFLTFNIQMDSMRFCTRRELSRFSIHFQRSMSDFELEAKFGICLIGPNKPASSVISVGSQ